MKVKIVDKKDDVKEMTIEELAGRRFVGVESVGHGKFLLVHTAYGWSFVNPDFNSCYLGTSKEDTSVKRIMEVMDSGRCFHTFDSARELYLWMAKE